MNREALIFGCGDIGIKSKHYLEEKGYVVKYFLDNDIYKWGKHVENIEVINPKGIINISYDLIAIGIYKAADTIKNQLLELGVNEEKIIFPFEPNRLFYNNVIETDKYIGDNKKCIIALIGKSDEEVQKLINTISEQYEIINQINIDYSNDFCKFEFLVKELFNVHHNSFIDKFSTEFNICTLSNLKINAIDFIINNIDEVKLLIKLLNNNDDYSIIISKSYKQYSRLYNILFFNNTLNFIHNRLDVECNIMFNNRLAELKKQIHKNNIPLEEVCVVSGAVLEVYGIRKTKKFDDIDIILSSRFRKVYGDGLIIVSENVEVHKANEYDIPDDEIILNPNNHFYYNGIKFMKLEHLYRNKTCKDNEKKLIDYYYKKINNKIN